MVPDEKRKNDGERPESEAERRKGFELQDQLTRVAASVPGVICSYRLRVDGSECMPYASPAIEDQLGLKPHEVAEDFGPIRARVHPDDADRVRAGMTESGRTLSPWLDTFRYQHPSKGEIWIEGHAVPSRECDGGILWHGYIQDVTQRKRMEEELSESERRYRVLSEDIPAMVRRFQPDGVISHVNDTYCKFFARTREDLVGRSFLWSIPDEDRGSVMANISALTIDSPTQSHEHEVIAPDGEIRWQRWTNRALFDAQGQTLAYQSVGEDVTERRRAQEELFATQQRLRAVMEGLPVGIAISRDKSCRAIEPNRALAILFGADPGDTGDNLSASAPDPRATGRLIRYFYEGRELRDSELPLQRAVAEQTPIPPMELEVELADRRRRLAEVSAAPIHDQRGQVIGGVAVVVDITERKRVEQALRDADRRKNEFLALLGHELRNPLAPIRNAVHVLSEQETLPDRVAWAVDVIRRQSQQLERLVNDLLDVARISIGRIQLRMAPVVVRDALDDALQGVSPLIDKRSQTLELRVDDAPVEVMADPVRLAQIFTNLLRNAIKYTPEGGRIWVTVERDNHQVVIRIRDDGIGIQPQELPRLFEIFSRGEMEPPRGEDVDGLGVGLPLARKLAEGHGGSLEGHSDGPGLGSEFVVALPVLSRTETTPPPPAEARRDGKTECKPRRVLVVDDNPDVADSFRVLLETMGHEVRALNTGGEALPVVQEWRPDVVFLDIAMPDMNGYEVAAAIATANLAHRPLVVALTGYGEDTYRGHELESEFDVHLLKPTDPARIRSLLDQLE